MKHLYNLTFTLLLLAPLTTFSQKMKIVSGNFDFLKDQREINVEFDYRGMTFYNENISENEYIKRRENDITQNKGKAEAQRWRADWEDSRDRVFVNKFLSLVNERSPLQFDKNPDAKYTLIVQTEWIYPGWFGGVMAQKAKVSTQLRFVETANRSKSLLTISSDKAPGNIAFVGVPNNNDRMAEGYAKTGKSLAALLQKKL
ncbi:MAG: hypothetical protein LBE37_17030 [Sphingobacterium sp.]|jgi:hypothetical protein|nr:hypothetical protein [Sphingobacterium sp.]